MYRASASFRYYTSPNELLRLIPALLKLFNVCWYLYLMGVPAMSAYGFMIETVDLIISVKLNRLLLVVNVSFCILATSSRSDTRFFIIFEL